MPDTAPSLFNRDGIDLANYRELLADAPESNDKKLRDAIIEMNCFNSVFVDCTASKDVAEIYQPLLEHNISVIAANKIAASSSYEKYALLKETALARGVFFRYETMSDEGDVEDWLASLAKQHIATEVKERKGFHFSVLKNSRAMPKQPCLHTLGAGTKLFRHSP